MNLANNKIMGCFADGKFPIMGGKSKLRPNKSGMLHREVKRCLQMFLLCLRFSDYFNRVYNCLLNQNHFNSSSQFTKEEPRTN